MDRAEYTKVSEIENAVYRAAFEAADADIELTGDDAGIIADMASRGAKIGTMLALGGADYARSELNMMIIKFEKESGKINNKEYEDNKR